MPRLHPIALAAPVLLALACTVDIGDSTSTTSTTTSGGTTTDTPAPTTTDPTPDTTGPTPTTSEGTTTADATTSTTDGTTGDAAGCMATAECRDGQFCWALYDENTMAPGDFTCQSECVDDAGGGNSEAVWCSDDAACCTPDATCDGTGYCIPPAGMTTTGDTDTSGTDGSGTDSSGTDSSGTDSSGTGSTGDTDTGGGVLPDITLSGLEVTANCQPAVPPDPISAKWKATFDNKQGVAEITAEVTGASLIFNPGVDEFVQGITVNPTSSGVVMAGKTAMVTMAKVKALVDLPMDCGQCGKPVGVEVVFDVDGQDITATAESTLECVF